MKLNYQTLASMIRKTFDVNVSINETGMLTYWFDEEKKEEAIEKLANALSYIVECDFDKEAIKKQMKIVDHINLGRIKFQLA